ncbi:MAG: alpha-galactosidase [Salana multivorans]|nr:alpha-galactosidase [Salana multivorans]
MLDLDHCLDLGETAVAGTIERRTAERLDAAVARCRLTVRVPHGTPTRVTVSDVPTARLTLPPGLWRADWFSSHWGDEFYPRGRAVGSEPLRLEVRAGRGSKIVHPWLCLTSPEHGAVVVSPAWSGNWAMTVTPTGDGGLTVTAGISPWKFARAVSAELPFVAPDVILARGTDRFDAGAALARAVGRWVAPTSAWSQRVATAWNHWWPYEDAEIDHARFVENAGIAARLGLDVATCDAGWFGRPDAGTFWERERGDWDDENTERFPAGLSGLAESVRASGIELGVWIEAEAVGVDARVGLAHPEILARRDDDPPVGVVPSRPAWQLARDGVLPPQEMPDPDHPAWLGYVCLGSPAGREHVRRVVERLIARTGARWIKWDFNLDPGAGCSRVDHGHDAGDGLYEHYRGLYALLDELRCAHPEVLWEACSSGGLRIDLGLAARFHTVFLSDPDWTEFHLQLLWGAAQLLPAASIFHFAESQWRGSHGSQNLDPATLDVATLDLGLHAVALHRHAVSCRLPDLSPELRDRLAAHVATHREHALPLIAAGGVVRPLTDQPMRDGGGERFPAFQLDAGGTGPVLLVAVRLDGGTARRVVRPVGLDPAATYAVTALGPGEDPGVGGTRATGASLMADGLGVAADGSARSWLLRLDRVTP